MIELSDIVTFHSYLDADETQRRIDRLARFGRPVICTEWLSRTESSTFASHLPVFAGNDPPVGWYVWGLVNGRTQTHIPPGSDASKPYEGPWKHDLLWRDGSPYDDAEIKLLRQPADARTHPA